MRPHRAGSAVYHLSTTSAEDQGPESLLEREVVKTIIALAPLWMALFPAEQARGLQLLIEHRSGQKAIITPDGSDAWTLAKARPDETLIRALARAHRWKRMLEAGKYHSIAEIAEAEKIDCSFVSRLLDLTLLAPDIQEGILDGRQPKLVTLQDVAKATSADWVEQRRVFGFTN